MSVSFSILSSIGISVSPSITEFGVIIPKAKIGKLLILDLFFTSCHPANVLPPYTFGCNMDLLGLFEFLIRPFLVGPNGLCIQDFTITSLNGSIFSCCLYFLKRDLFLKISLYVSHAEGKYVICPLLFNLL